MNMNNENSLQFNTWFWCSLSFQHQHNKAKLKMMFVLFWLTYNVVFYESSSARLWRTSGYMTNPHQPWNWRSMNKGWMIVSREYTRSSTICWWMNSFKINSINIMNNSSSDHLESEWVVRMRNTIPREITMVILKNAIRVNSILNH